MLKSLEIKNFGSIYSSSLTFTSSSSSSSSDLTIISGESGSGKSLIFKAISFLTGNDLIEEPDLFSAVKDTYIKGIFHLHPSFSSFKDNSCCVERFFSSHKKQKILVNNQVISLKKLKNIFKDHVRICTQNFHLSLYNKKTHLYFLDVFSGTDLESKEFEKELKQYKNIYKQYLQRKNLFLSHQNEKEEIKNQIQEIEKADLLEEEEIILNNKKKFIESRVLRMKSVLKIQNFLENKENELEKGDSLLSLMKKGLNEFIFLEKLDPSQENLKKKWESLFYELKEISFSLSDYEKLLSQEESDLASLSDRISFISSLKRKYGQSIKDIKIFIESQKKKLSFFEEEFFHLKEIEKKLPFLREKIVTLDRSLKTKREKKLPFLREKVLKEIQDLGIKDILFEIEVKNNNSLEPLEWNDKGSLDISFCLKNIHSQKIRNLKEGVSGGELSRITFALYYVISALEESNLYLFDELDTGLSGSSAFEMGKKYQSFAFHHQLICVTHLPQVASFGNDHFYVEKNNTLGFFSSHISCLKKEDRMKEIARMLAGPKITEKNLDNALEMYDLAQKEKLHLSSLNK